MVMPLVAFLARAAPLPRLGQLPSTAAAETAALLARRSAALATPEFALHDFVELAAAPAPPTGVRRLAAMSLRTGATLFEALAAGSASLAGAVAASMTPPPAAAASVLSAGAPAASAAAVSTPQATSTAFQSGAAAGSAAGATDPARP